MRQLTFEDLSDTSHNLLCVNCLEHTVTLTSQFAEHKGCQFYHKAECSNCGHTSYPCGVKSFLLEVWEDDVYLSRNYARLKGWL